MLEKKLNITSKRKSKKVFEETGLDNNFFDFLDKIHKDVHSDLDKYQKSNLPEEYEDKSENEESMEDEESEDLFGFQKDVEDEDDEQEDESEDYEF